MKATQYLLMAAVAMTFAACSNDDDIVQDGPVEAKIFASFGVETRAVNTDNTWTAGDAIGIRVTNAPTSTTGMTDRYQNVKYIANSTAQSSDFSAVAGQGIFFQNASETVTFAAYYPYQTSNANALPGTNADGVITVNTKNNNTSANQASIDFLFATGATASNSSPEVSFTGEANQFKHCMAQLNLVIQASTTDGFTDDEAMNIVNNNTTYKLGGLIHNGTFNVTSGATATTGNADDSWDITGLVHKDVNVTTPTRTYSLILLPQNLSGRALSFSAAIAGQTYTNTTNIKPDLEPGKKYTYTITLKKTGIELSGCTVAPWETGTTGAGSVTLLDVTLIETIGPRRE